MNRPTRHGCRRLLHRVTSAAACLALLLASAIPMAEATATVDEPAAETSIHGTPDVDAARSAVARADASLAAARRHHADAVGALDAVRSRIRVVERQLPRLEHRTESLREEMEARAVALYVGGGREDLSVVQYLDGSGEFLDAARGRHLADVAQVDLDDAVGSYERERARLDGRRRALLALTERQQELVEQRAAAVVRSEQAARDAAAALRVAEQAVSLERYALAQAARLAAASTTTTVPGAAHTDDAPVPQHSPAAPALAAFVPVEDLRCPVEGATVFTDDWGQPRSGWRVHQGTDIFAPAGTPNVAVADGVARQRVGGLAGNGLWLDADDGNRYFYAHLDRFEGAFPNGARRVAAGETIGFTGATGNASGGAPHTHFEIHPQAAGPANPYPMLRDMCAATR